MVAASTISQNLPACRDAPPIRPPSTSGLASSSAALPGFMLPPYWMVMPSATASPYSSPTTLRMAAQTSWAWSAVAVCDAVEQVCGLRPGIKWPNDVILDGRKLCGILTELELEGETAALRYVVAGIGVNLSQSEADFGPEVAPVAISLAQALGKAPRRAEMAAALLDALDKLDRDFPGQWDSWLERYRADCITVGRQIKVLRGQKERIGTAVGVDHTFALVVRWADGSEEALSSGEVSVRGLLGYV